MTIHLHRRLATVCIAGIAALLLSACVSTRISSELIDKRQGPIERTLIVVRTGTMSDKNMAGLLGQKNIDGLMPSLLKRLPPAFAAAGIDARASWSETITSDDAVWLGRAPLLLIQPVRATYNSQTGQTLTISARFLDAASRKEIWTSELFFYTMGFGKFDDKLADEVGVKLLAEMKGAGLLPTPPVPR